MLFFFNDTATTEIYTLSLHDALPILYDLNKEIKYALNYHEATKHSEASLLTSRHYLDFDNKPIPFKIYRELPSISLPTSFPTPEVDEDRKKHTSELQSRQYLVCRLLLEKKKNTIHFNHYLLQH